jgi:hypothetical protein
MGQDDYDLDALMAGWAEDAVWDGTSELGVGETLKGKKAIAEWFERWKKEFPKRKLVAKNVCMRGTCWGRMSIVDTKAFTLPALIQRSIAGHTLLATGSPA